MASFAHRNTDVPKHKDASISSSIIFFSLSVSISNNLHLRVILANMRFEFTPCLGQTFGNIPDALAWLIKRGADMPARTALIPKAGAGAVQKVAVFLYVATTKGIQ